MKNYGTLKFLEDRHLFAIECEPHVSMRLKRVFGKLSVGSFGTHLLHASDETARDLEWFMQRYPFSVDPDTSKQLEQFCTSHRQTETYIRDFYEGRAEILPFDLAVPAREYQKEAASLWHRVKGYLLADDVGLGKTASSIAGLTKRELLPAVVVTLAHLPRQWQEEVHKFAPQLSTHIIKKGTPYKITNGSLPGVDGVPDVLIMNYHKLAGWSETLAEIARSVVFDEVQDLRRSESNKYAAARHLAQCVEYRIGLSATPIYNYGGEFYNVLDILAPGKLGSREEFGREWCEWGGYSDTARIKDPRAFGLYTREAGLMLRRTRAEVKREIPPISKFSQIIEADTEALNKVSKSCAELARFILRGEEVNRGDKMRASEELSNKLRQATGIAKAPYVAAFVKILLESGEKVVLYGWHRACFAKGTPVLMADGSTRPVETVTKGEQVLGPDSNPRTVQSLIRGTGEMFRVVPTKGDPWICNEHHLLSLYYAANVGYERVVTMSVREYLDLPARSKRSYTLYRADELHLNETENPQEPWLVGYWLGDGDSRLSMAQVASADPEIVSECQLIADRHELRLVQHASPGITGTSECKHLRFSGRMGNKDNPLLKWLRDLGLKGNKHIPDSYKRASVHTRRELLAGLIDSDGHVYKNNGVGTAEITSVVPALTTDILYVARSLGLAAYVSLANATAGYGAGRRRPVYRITISGDLTRLPMRIARKAAPVRRSRKSVLRTGFKIEAIGSGDYYGFQVDGDHLFLLGDFTVVHNCYDIWLDQLAEFKPVMYTGSESSTQKEKSKQEFVTGDSQLMIISLRAGAGLDGLQQTCKTVVFGELDWSPGVHEQAIGRVARDGQEQPVMAYFLIAETGSDPVMIDVNGVKKMQIEGIRNHDGKMFEKLQSDPNHIKRLAEDYLNQSREAANAR